MKNEVEVRELQILNLIQIRVVVGGNFVKTKVECKLIFYFKVITLKFRDKKTNLIEKLPWKNL